MEVQPWAQQHCLIDGHRLAYVRCGAGEPLLLVHGLTTSSFIWDDLLPILEARHDVIAVDLLGTGDSDRPVPSDCSLQKSARHSLITMQLFPVLVFLLNGLMRFLQFFVLSLGM